MWEGKEKIEPNKQNQQQGENQYNAQEQETSQNKVGERLYVEVRQNKVAILNTVLSARNATTSNAVRKQR